MYSWQAVGMHSTGRLSWHCLQSLGQGNFYRPQRSSDKVIFSQVCVILFTGGSASVHARNPPQTRHPSPVQSMLGDTVNTRVVYILLQCNLFSQVFVGGVSTYGSGGGAPAPRTQTHPWVKGQQAHGTHHTGMLLCFIVAKCF